MNVIDKRKMLEGLTFFMTLSKDTTEAEMDAVIDARDALKKPAFIYQARTVTL